MSTIPGSTLLAIDDVLLDELELLPLLPFPLLDDPPVPVLPDEALLPVDEATGVAVDPEEEASRAAPAPAANPTAKIPTNMAATPRRNRLAVGAAGLGFQPGTGA
jgi:hypothetical protein